MSEKEMFVTLEEFEEIERCYEVEFNGLSGAYCGYNWFTATNGDEMLELYLKVE